MTQQNQGGQDPTAGWQAGQRQGSRKQFRFAQISKVLAGGALLAICAPAPAVVVDLINGDSGTANGTLYYWVPQQSTGTGVIEPFLRVQGNETEQGYNTSIATAQDPWDTKQGLWTHDLRL